MYNRYIPQNDGSYRRSRIQEPSQVHPAAQKMSAEPEKTIPPTPLPPLPKRYSQPQSALDFFRKLLPRGLDTEDLIILLLLLLMSADSREDQNHALLTLVLYLFL